MGRNKFLKEQRRVARQALEKNGDRIKRILEHGEEKARQRVEMQEAAWLRDLKKRPRWMPRFVWRSLSRIFFVRPLS